jgi:hypothetical protein
MTEPAAPELFCRQAVLCLSQFELSLLFQHPMVSSLQGLPLPLLSAVHLKSPGLQAKPYFPEGLCEQYHRMDGSILPF